MFYKKKILTVAVALSPLTAAFAGTGFEIKCPFVPYHSVIKSNYLSLYSESANPTYNQKKLTWTLKPATALGLKQGPHQYREKNTVHAVKVEKNEPKAPFGKLVCSVEAYQTQPVYKTMRVLLLSPLPKHYYCNVLSHPKTEDISSFVCFFSEKDILEN